MPTWFGDAFLMLQFGYDEQQVENMSIAVKTRLMFLFSQVEKRKAEARNEKNPTARR